MIIFFDIFSSAFFLFNVTPHSPIFLLFSPLPSLHIRCLPPSPPHPSLPHSPFRLPFLILCLSFFFHYFLFLLWLPYYIVFLDTSLVLFLFPPPSWLSTFTLLCNSLFPCSPFHLLFSSVTSSFSHLPQRRSKAGISTLSPLQFYLSHFSNVLSFLLSSSFKFLPIFLSLLFRDNIPLLCDILSISQTNAIPHIHTAGQDGAPCHLRLIRKTHAFPARRSLRKLEANCDNFSRAQTRTSVQITWAGGKEKGGRKMRDRETEGERERERGA